MSTRRTFAALAMVLAVAGIWLLSRPAAPPAQPALPAPPMPATAPAVPGKLTAYQRHLPRVMGTVATITVVAGEDQAALATVTLDEAEGILRALEAKMSTYIADSEMTRLNTAPVGQLVKLSPETLQVLGEARAFTPRTQGAFDVTCRPVLEMWRDAGRRKALPTTAEARQAVDATGWRWFELTDGGAVRRSERASIDLGGIGKKYGIDRATEAMMRRGVSGGMLNVGGDIRCFGQRVGGGAWRVGLRNPFSNDPNELMGVVAIPNGSVCTSGNYERFVEIDGRRYSHIVDPRTGATCDDAPSVTVIGPDAESAGLWATSLSVLGLEGLRLLPSEPSLEVMMVVGRTPAESRWYRTQGFDELLLDKLAMPPTDLPPGLWASSRPSTRPGAP